MTQEGRASDNGGSAFPVALYGRGMTLRDYFAAKALQAQVTDPDYMASLLTVARKAGITVAEYVADAAYEYADAMLKARGAKS